MIHYSSCEDRECIMCKSLRSAVKEEHWGGVKRKLSFIDRHCTCSMCEPVRVAAGDEHWEGVRRKLSFSDTQREHPIVVDK
jgi:hypothetical protein